MKIYFAINIGILIILSTIFVNLSILVVGLTGFFILLIITKDSKQKCYIHLSIIFVISIIFMIILYYGYIAQYGTPYYIGGSDDLQFEQYSNYIIDQNYYSLKAINQDPKFRWYSANGFLWVLSWLIRFCNLFGGYHTIVFRVLNIYFLLILSVLVFNYFTEKYNLERKQNLLVLYTLALFPNAQFISFHIFRDTLNILLLFSIYYLVDKYNKKKKEFLFTVILIILFSYILFWFRKENLYFILTIILVSLIMKDNRLSIRNIWLALILGFISIILLNTFNIFSHFNRFYEYYSSYNIRDIDGLSTIIFSMKLLPFGILLRIVYGLISPFPAYILYLPRMFDNINIFFNVIIAFGVIIQIFMMPYLFKNINIIDKNTIIFTIFFLVTVVTTFTFRHFIMLYPFMAILIFRQFFKTSNIKKILNLSYAGIFLSIAGSIYFYIKL